MTNGAGDIDRPAKRVRYQNRTPGSRSNASTANGANGSKSPRNGQRSRSPTNHRQNFDRYTALARTALSNGDTIEAENYYQHAEHYFRQMNEPTALSH